METRQIFERLIPIINMIDASVICQSVVDNGDGSYTFQSKYTKWLTPGYNITILGVEYFITSVDFNNTITVTGPSLPTVLTFDIYRPIFKHGTMKRVANELNEVVLQAGRLPLIWLKEILDERIHFDVTESIDNDADCNLYFITACDFPNWSQLDGDVKAIRPMRALMNEFIKVLANNQYVAELTSVGQVKNFKNFGTYDDKGVQRNIFNEPLSAVHLRITIPFFKECDCCDGSQLDNRPAPGYVLDNAGNILAVLYSNEYYIVQGGGTCLPVTILDQYGNTIDSVASGGTYEVTALESIVDTINENEYNIIEQLN